MSAIPEDLPWYHAEPDADLVALFDDVLPARGARVLDLGAGPAVHSITLARRGHRVVAIDGVPEARDMALVLAAKHGVGIELLRRTRFPGHDEHDHAAWTVLAVRIAG